MIRGLAKRLNAALDTNVKAFREVFGSHVMSVQALRELIDVLVATKPKTVLELGSGLSSVLLGVYAKATGCKVKSLNMPGEWHDKLLALWPKDLPAIDFVVVDVDSATGWYAWTPSAEDVYDLVIVDGPDRWKSRVAPAGLATVKHVLAHGSTLVVDDINDKRPELLSCYADITSYCSGYTSRKVQDTEFKKRHTLFCIKDKPCNCAESAREVADESPSESAIDNHMWQSAQRDQPEIQSDILQEHNVRLS